MTGRERLARTRQRARERRIRNRVRQLVERDLGPGADVTVQVYPRGWEACAGMPGEFPTWFRCHWPHWPREIVPACQYCGARFCYWRCCSQALEDAPF